MSCYGAEWWPQRCGPTAVVRLAPTGGRSSTAPGASGSAVAIIQGGAVERRGNDEVEGNASLGTRGECPRLAVVAGRRRATPGKWGNSCELFSPPPPGRALWRPQKIVFDRLKKTGRQAVPGQSRLTGLAVARPPHKSRAVHTAPSRLNDHVSPRPCCPPPPIYPSSWERPPHSFPTPPHSS